MRVRNFRFGYAEIVSTLALVMATSGTAYAAATVGTADIQDGAVTTPKLATEAVTSAKIANNSVSLADIVGADSNGTITFTLAAHSCGKFNITAGGAVAGQAAFLSWTSAVPLGVVLGPLRVADTNLVAVVACNLLSNSVHYENVGVRIVTFS